LRTLPIVVAYRHSTYSGFSPDEIASRFGISPLIVKRYLKLTNVSPRFFALYAEGNGDAPKPLHSEKFTRMLTVHRTRRDSQQ
jgi:transposase